MKGRTIYVGILVATLAGWTSVAGGQVYTGPLVLAQTSAVELEFWRSVEDTKDPAELEAYLKAYPNGQFAPLAAIRLQKLKGAKPQSATGGDPEAVTPAARTDKSADTVIPPAPPHKASALIGLQIRSVNDKRAGELGLAAASGVEVIGVLDGTPAAKSGFRPADVVLSVNGQPMVDAPHYQRITFALSPGQSVKFSMMRDRQRQTLDVTAADWFENRWIAAHRGNPASMMEMATFYLNGIFVDRNSREANVWLHRAADAGNATAMQALGWRYERGLGFDQNDREAIRWYRKAADAGNTDAMFSLAFHYQQGRGVERNAGESARWNKMAGEKGHTGGLYAYGLALMNGAGVAKNDSLAVDYFRRAAKLNQALAFAALGNAYYAGRGVEKDHRQAADWYRRAADRNIAGGALGLGLMYERGQGGLPKNRDEAIKHYRKAAEARHPYALERLKALKASVYDPKEVQQLLSDYGIDPGPIDGRMTERTMLAIRAFQMSRGLNGDGEASLHLVGQLREALKQKTAAASTAAKADTSPAPAPDLGGLKDLEKLDALK